MSFFVALILSATSLLINIHGMEIIRHGDGAEQFVSEDVVDNVPMTAQPHGVPLVLESSDVQFYLQPSIPWSEITEAVFLEDIGAKLNKPGTITSDFDRVVDLSYEAVYTVRVQGEDIAGNKSNIKIVKVVSHGMSNDEWNIGISDGILICAKRIPVTRSELELKNIDFLALAEVQAWRISTGEVIDVEVRHSNDEGMTFVAGRSEVDPWFTFYKVVNREAQEAIDGYDFKMVLSSVSEENILRFASAKEFAIQEDAEKEGTWATIESIVKSSDGTRLAPGALPTENEDYDITFVTRSGKTRATAHAQIFADPATLIIEGNDIQFSLTDFNELKARGELETEMLMRANARAYMQETGVALSGLKADVTDLLETEVSDGDAFDVRIFCDTSCVSIRTHGSGATNTRKIITVSINKDVPLLLTGDAITVLEVGYVVFVSSLGALLIFEVYHRRKEQK